MDAMKWASALVLALASGCVGGSSDTGGTPDATAVAGTEGAPCYPNGTCNAGLECRGDGSDGSAAAGGECGTGSSNAERWPGPCIREYEYDDGTVDSRLTYTYDANGNVLTEEYDEQWR